MDLYLEQDDEAQTLDFIARHNSRCDAELRDAAFDRDSDAIQAMIEREDRLVIATQLGRWLLHFHRSKNNPLGLWRRLPAEQVPRAEAKWESVFDLDAFCAAEGERWLFNGAVPCPQEPTRVLLHLSKGGSDLVRVLEFDVETKAVVEGGFDLPPVRANARWLNRDEICYFGAIDRHSATRSGWPRIGRRLGRGERPEDAPVLFAAEDSDVTGWCQVIQPGPDEGPDARPVTLFFRHHEIGKASAFVDGEGVEGGRRRVDLPVEVDFGFSRRYCLWHAKSDERVASGSLVLQRFAPFEPDMLDKEARILFQPEEGEVVWQFLLLRDWIVFVVRNRLAPRLFLLDLSEGMGGEIREMELPEHTQAIHVMPRHGDLHFGNDDLFVAGHGFLQPPTLYSLALSDRSRPPALEPLASQPPLFETDGMRSELLEAVSADGTKIPYHIVFPKSWAEGRMPVLLYGYGGFNAPLGPYYSGVNGLWVAAGGAYVQAYIRGGGEFGAAWHNVAKRDGRPKAFDDFVAVARDLVERGYTKPAHIACSGASNGGLLTSVMATRFPEDFGAVWTRVPVIDMTRFHKFPAGAAWIDEYGDPDVPDDLDFLLAYSPLHAIRPASEVAYPRIYIESSSNDDRVHPSHARRFAAKLEAMGHAPLFREFGSGGHGGGGNTREQAERMAIGYSFLRHTIMKA